MDSILNNNVLIEIENQTTSPSDIKVEWEDRSCCCFNIAYFPIGGFSICEHWRISFSIPILVSLSIFISAASFYIHNFGIFSFSIIFPNNTIKIIACSCVIVFMLFLSISYCLSICKGPGYAPYNWSINQRTDYSFNDMMSSIAIYREQVEYAKVAQRPPRSSFSINTRRFVLRADHYCSWMQSWIGVRNHRYFILTCFWTFLYCFSIIISNYYWIVHWFNIISKTRSFNLLLLPNIFVLLYLLALGAFSFKQFFTAVINLAKDSTLIEIWNNRIQVMHKKTCFDSYESICGPKGFCLCWPFPIFGFTPKQNGFYNYHP